MMPCGRPFRSVGNEWGVSLTDRHAPVDPAASNGALGVWRRIHEGMLYYVLDASTTTVLLGWKGRQANSCP